MNDHFAAYSFVDRITELVPGQRARGVFHVPAGLPPLSSCLVAEAVGQLAAWVSMAHIDFRGRPVAALANETILGHAVPAGSRLDLAVEIDDCDDDAVAYKGWADVNGERVITLNDCLGPMLPVAEFDSPEAMRARFELITGQGAAPDRFRGVAAPRMDVHEGEPAKWKNATLYVPDSAPFFADHFPRRAVFPATLLLDSEIRVALSLADEISAQRGGPSLVPSRMTHVKVRAFMSPGDVLDIAAEASTAGDGTDRIMLTTRANGKNVATARLELSVKE